MAQTATPITLGLIFGDQLDRHSALLQKLDPKTDVLWMAEVHQAQTTSSKMRSLVCLSAMRHFRQHLKQTWTLDYTELSQQVGTFDDALTAAIARHRPQRLCAVLPGDQSVHRRIQALAEAHDLPLQWLADSHFISRPGEFTQWLQGRKAPRMEHWYRALRKDRGILMQANGQPEGDQWNFDKANRKAFGHHGPQSLRTPQPFASDAIVQAVKQDLAACCPDLPGNWPQTDGLLWPITPAQAQTVLEDFIQKRLAWFGDYQDAIWLGEPWLYHARLSSALNLKLLSPAQVIKAAENAYHDGEAPLNAVEGFIRQILGWREYVRGLYWSHRELWHSLTQTDDPGALNATADLPQFYWHGQTQMACLHDALQPVLAHGYGHHIQRLMVTGLFALLWGVQPRQIHQWYGTMYVDAVDWVEVPNTLGMSQYADGGIVGSKPYIASGAYIDRMSNACQHCRYHPKRAIDAPDKNQLACPVTTLYWDFVARHEGMLSQNPRLGMQVKNWQRKTETEQVATRTHAHWLRQHPESL
jgi:deoxyribodipyrimidine photolyase-related protein